MSRISPLLAAAVATCAAGSARAENLFRGQPFSALATDRRATQVGDTLTVIILQSAESVNSAQSNSARSTRLAGGLSAGPVNESGQVSLGSENRGGGEMRRSERLAAQMTVTVVQILPNGDFVVAGDQQVRVNGNRTNIGVRGRIRPADISGQNTVPSVRVADAMINYDGRGFVSRSAVPGLLGRLFGLLGL